MCCLFGLIDYRHHLTGRKKSRIISILASACEIRGTDATGIAYNVGGTQRIYKRPVPAHCMHIRIPESAQVMMGHTRMTTQGSAKRNYNNHPFPGSAGKDVFALAHNGVLHNDEILRREFRLPRTKIQTDSYIAVQLIEQQNALNFESLRYMAENVEGSFTFTVLDRKDRLYIVKGDNPLCLFHFPSLGMYLYASTEEILRHAISRMGLGTQGACKITLECGDILRIDRDGTLTRSTFDTSRLFARWQAPFWDMPYRSPWAGTGRSSASGRYLEEVKSVAAAFGYAPEEIDRLAEAGFSPEELEEFLYCGQS
jgi:glucosamine--fructose-6-phosphate aminotransferase (isomerizing)